MALFSPPSWLKLDQFRYFSETHRRIFFQLNFLALFCAGSKLIFALLLCTYLTSINSYVAYTLPVAICLTVYLLIYYKIYDWALFLSFFGVPAAIFNLCLYEPLTGVGLYALCYTATIFFTVQNSRLKIFYFLFNTIGFAFVTVKDAQALSQYRQMLPFIIFNLFLFTIVYYINLDFIRGFIKKSKIVIRTIKESLLQQNELLEKQNEEILHQSQQLEISNNKLLEASNFNKKINAVLSHDIRTPIVSIQNILSSYTQKKLTQEELLKFIPAIHDEILYINQIFEETLTWSKSQFRQKEAAREMIPLFSKVNHICKSYGANAKSKNLTIVNHINPNLEVSINSNHFNIIMRNLLSNAIKYSNTGGKILIEAERLLDFHKISIIDEGIGISAEKLINLKEGLDIVTKGTRNETGAGLGLLFCKDFIQSAGGELIIESKQYEGSKFSFTLPIVPATQSS